MRVLFVCTGNTCRSPMAAGILRKLLDGRGISDVEADSCGFAGDGMPVTTYAAEVAGENGIDIRDHRSKMINGSLVESAGLILAMSRRHKDEIIRYFPQAEGKTFTLAEFAGERGDVEDPMGMGRDVYVRTFGRLHRLIGKSTDKIIDYR